MLLRGLERLCVTLETGLIDGGTCRSAISRWIADTAGPSGALPFRLKLIVTDGNCPWWFTDSGDTVVCCVTSSLNGTMPEVCERT